MSEVPAELLRDFTEWAERKNKPVDVMMLDQMLSLRTSYDRLEPSYWPTGSVEHLLLERLPTKGPVDTYEPDVVVDTLDAYFRFLRSTGRMSGRSADLKELTKEARRSARLMAELSDDRVNWSPNKVLADFGRSVGIDLDTAGDVETLQQRLAQIQDAWNALPAAERRRLMPHPEDADDDELSEGEVAMRHFGTDHWVQALLLTFAPRLPEGELPPPEQVAPLVEKTGLMDRLLALADWVGEGREVTSTGVLRPALAKRAYTELGLEEWTYAQLRRQYPDETLPGVAAVGRDTWIEQEAQRPWSRAADCEALHRLWLAAAETGLIEIGRKRAVSTQMRPEDPLEWVKLALLASVEVMEQLLDRPRTAVPVLFALMTSYVDQRRLVPWGEIVQLVDHWWNSPADRRALARDAGWWDAYRRSEALGALGRIADTGLVEESDAGVALTDFGDVFVTAWLGYMEQH